MEGDSDNEEDGSKLTNDTSRDRMNHDNDVNDPVNVSNFTEF